MSSLLLPAAVIRIKLGNFPKIAPYLLSEHRIPVDVVPVNIRYIVIGCPSRVIVTSPVLGSFREVSSSIHRIGCTGDLRRAFETPAIARELIIKDNIVTINKNNFVKERA